MYCLGGKFETVPSTDIPRFHFSLEHGVEHFTHFQATRAAIFKLLLKLKERKPFLNNGTNNIQEPCLTLTNRA